MSKIVYVTGAAGFLGRYACQAFARAGWKVYGLGFGDWKESEYKEWGVTSWLEGAIEEAKLLHLLGHVGAPDVIVHCAGGSSVGFSNMEPGNDFMRTVASTSIVLEFIRKFTQETKVIYPSSAAVYGNQIESLLVEDLLPKPYSQYGINKYLAEQLIWSYTKNFKIESIVVRFFSLYGKGLRKQLLWDACQKLNSKFLFGGTGNEIRDFLHITDAANLILHCAMNDSSDDFKIINGGSGVGVTVQQMLSKLAGFSDVTVSPVFSGEVRLGDPQFLVADIEKAKIIGWTPKVNLEQGIQEYVTWFIKNRSQSV